MEIRRAIDPATGKPWPKLTLTQRTMKELLTAFVNGWGKRQLLKAIVPLTAVIGASAQGAEQVTLFITAGAVHLLEMFFSNKARKNK